jgi:hypothetical protein
VAAVRDDWSVKGAESDWLSSAVQIQALVVMQSTFKIPYVYDYITKLRRKQAEVIQNHENVRNIGQGEARRRKYKRLKLGGGQAYDRSNELTAVVANTTRNMA